MPRRAMRQDEQLKSHSQTFCRTQQPCHIGSVAIRARREEMSTDGKVWKSRKLLAVAGAVLGTVGAGCERRVASASAPPPPTVEIAPVIQKDVPVQGEWVGTLEGYVNAQIQPQVSGYLIRQDYHEGALVKKGDVLFEIDPRPFQAVLDQAKGQLAQARGQLGQAQAQLELTKINVKRDTPLAAARAIARSQLDNDIESEKQAEATILANQASIKAAEAAV